MTPTLLCVHPHPDDESIACGGVLARAADEGARAVVVTCTRGEEGENLAGIDLGDVPIVEHRMRELRAALDVLGVQGRYQLGYRDSGMAGTSSTKHPDAFHNADVDAVAHRLATIIRTEQPHVVVSDAADGGYGHPDHIQGHHVTVAATALAADPMAAVTGEPWRVPKRYVQTFSRRRLERLHEALVQASLPSPFDDDGVVFGADDTSVTTRVDVRPWLSRKRAAMVAHATQIGEASFFLNTPEELFDEMFGLEEFILEESGLASGGGAEDHLFAGLDDAGE